MTRRNRWITMTERNILDEQSELDGITNERSEYMTKRDYNGKI